ncbi:hypothetical protein SDC9_165056 [bioreactor metagenome]|uniref:Uncharacterized protein n=1 Tax=bioreactor metagenome TaxID=1076179 RepID=A0A645FTC1_9ZZZZ
MRQVLLHIVIQTEVQRDGRSLLEFFLLDDPHVLDAFCGRLVYRSGGDRRERVLVYQGQAQLSYPWKGEEPVRDRQQVEQLGYVSDAVYS